MRKLDNKKSKIILIYEKVSGYLDILICLLTFILTLSKGGFYKSDVLFPTLIICLLGLVCISIKLYITLTDHRVLKGSKYITVLDFAVMCLPIAYAMPLVFKTYASLESSIFEAVRWVTVAIVYYIVRSSQNRKIYLNTIAMIGVVVGIFGLDELTFNVLDEVFSFASIGYLTDAGGRLSSIIQYANVSALFMLISITILQYKLVNNTKKIWNNIYQIAIAFLSVCIVFTTSRMNIALMCVEAIAMSLFCVKNKLNHKYDSFILMMFALVLASVVEQPMMNGQNILTYVCLIIYFALIVGFNLLLNNKTIVNELKKITIKDDIKDKKWILYTGVVIIIAFILASISLTTSFKLKANNGESKDTRWLYNINKNGENSIAMNIASSPEAEYIVHIFKVTQDARRVYLNEYNQNKTEKEITFKLDEDVVKIELEIVVSKGEVEISDVVFNQKRITMSYLVLPDSMVFRLKDTFLGDNNNIMRMTYYEDSMKLFRFSPLIGIGGEGFLSRYQEVQDSGYISSEVHSMPIQLLVESGIFGLFAYVAIILMVLAITIRLLKEKQIEIIVLMLAICAFVIQSTFDLTFSFGVMQMLYIILIGLVANVYKEKACYSKDEYQLNNKSVYGYVKTVVLSLSVIVAVITCTYSYKIYNASMLQTPDLSEGKISLQQLEEAIIVYENKIENDKYNVSYIRTLYEMYDAAASYYRKQNLSNADNKEEYQRKLQNIIVKQKQLIDNAIEYEYYNKYILHTAANCYFENYTYYANIYSEQFDGKETSYGFYLGYAIKLTERLKIVGANNANARIMRSNIYEQALDNLKKQNAYLNSTAIAEVVHAIEEKMEDIKCDF